MSPTSENNRDYHHAKLRRSAMLVAVLAGVFALALPYDREEEDSDASDNRNRNHSESNEQSQKTLADLFGKFHESQHSDGEVVAELKALEAMLAGADAKTLSSLLPELTNVLDGLQPPTVWPVEPSLSEVQTLSRYVNDALAHRLQRDQAHQDNLVRSAIEEAASVSRVEIARANARLQIEIERQVSLERQIEAQRVKAHALSKRNERKAALQAELADVDSLLKPFISAGHYQPASRTNAWDMKWTVEAMPVSLSRLRDLGALEKSPAGLLALYIVGGAKAPGASHDRPLGTFPQCWAGHLEKPKVRDAVQRAQELLRMHGEALVEQGLLAP